MVRKKVGCLIIAGGLLLLCALAIIGLFIPLKPAELPPTPFQLKQVAFSSLALPSGDEIAQAGSQVLFLSSPVLEQAPTTVVAFSLQEQREMWRVDLAAPPYRAVQAGSWWLIATVRKSPASKSYVAAVDAASGRLAWQQAVEGVMAAIAQDESGRIWLSSAEGIFQVNPATGDLTPALRWEKAKGYGENRSIAAFTGNGTHYLAATVGSRLFLYEETSAGWNQVWQFESAGLVWEIHPVSWMAGEPAHLVVLSRGIVYDIRPDGSVAWRVETAADLNMDGQAIRCGAEGTVLAFRNFLGAVYLLDAKGVLRQWNLPGGAAHLGIFPLPFPEHVAVGLSVGNINADAQDELAVRSLKQLFIFDCQATLLATVPINADTEGGIVLQLRNLPRYRPLVYNGQVLVAEQDRITAFTLGGNQ